MNINVSICIRHIRHIFNLSKLFIKTNVICDFLKNHIRVTGTKKGMQVLLKNNTKNLKIFFQNFLSIKISLIFEYIENYIINL